MSRWCWHDRHGVVKGPIKRVSDTPKLMDIETKVRAQRMREWAYQHANSQHPLYAWLRECARSDCDVKRPQAEMIWSGSAWLCLHHYEELLVTD
jgi:hypothetical protein